MFGCYRICVRVFVGESACVCVCVFVYPRVRAIASVRKFVCTSPVCVCMCFILSVRARVFVRKISQCFF